MLRKNRRDMRQHAIHVGEYIIVPETQHLPALPFEPGRARCVRHAIRMLAAIDLYDQAPLHTGEIGDMVSDGMLSAKLIARDLPRPQRLPEPLFGIGQVMAQYPRALRGHA